MRSFKKFFKLKTGREWDQRFDEAPVSPKRDLEGNVLPADEGWYYYEGKVSLLANFLRNGPGSISEVGSAAQGNSEDLMTEGTGCREGGSETEKVHEKKDRSPKEMAIGTDEDAVDGKGSKTGSSMERAILID